MGMGPWRATGSGARARPQMLRRLIAAPPAISTPTPKITKPRPTPPGLLTATKRVGARVSKVAPAATERTRKR